MLKILGGEFRSRPLSSPPEEPGDDITRPITSRVKESLFNLLRGWFEGARVLDLFAGVGTLGLEAVSRGASQVILIERDREIYGHLQRNIVQFRCADRAVAIQADALGPIAVERAPAPVDIVFLDPPYPLMEDPETRAKVLAQAQRLRSLMAPKSFLVLRSPIDLGEEAALEGFDGPEVHSYGRGMRVMLYMPKKTHASPDSAGPISFDNSGHPTP
jgi:16S rRNA (guanine966-N2)-methyltransferase